MQRVILASSLAINSTCSHFMRSIVALLSILTLFATHVHASAYNVNDAFIANENAIGGPVDPNGPYTYGYNFTPATPTAISTTGLVHSGVNGFNGSMTPEPGVQGFFFPNNASVPAVLGNITNSTIVTNFGPTLKPGELLLHPGGTSSNGFAPPFADGDLQYTVAGAGPYEISGSFEALDTGNTGISVYVNGVQAFTAADGAQGTITPFSLFESLTAGSTIAFVVSPGPGGIGNNSTGLFANIMAVPEPSSLVALAGLCGIGLVGLVLRRRRKGAQRTALFCSLAVACFFAAANLASAAAINVVNVDLEGYRGAEVAPTTYVGTGATGTGGMVFNGLSPTVHSDTSSSTGTGDQQTISSVGGLLDSNGFLTHVNFTVGPVGVDNTAGTPANNTSSALFGDYIFNDASAGNSGVNAAFTISGLTAGSSYNVYLYGSGGTGNIAGITLTGGSTPVADTVTPTTIFDSSNTLEFTLNANGSGDILGTMTGPNVLGGFSISGAIADVPEPSSLVAFAGLCGIGLVGLVLRRRRRGAQRTAMFCSLAVVCFFAAANLASAGIVNVDLEGYRTGELPPTTYSGSGAAGGGNVFNGLSPAAVSDGSSTSTGDLQTISSVGGLLDSNGFLSRVNFTISSIGVDDEAPGAAANTAPALFNDYVFNHSAGSASFPGNSNFTISGLIPFSTDSVYLYAGFADVGHLANTTITGGTLTAFTATSPFDASDTELFVATANSLGQISGTMGTGTNIIAGFTVAGVGVQDVPEPSSLVAFAGLCGIGLVGLVLRRRRHSA